MAASFIHNVMSFGPQQYLKWPLARTIVVD